MFSPCAQGAFCGFGDAEEFEIKSCRDAAAYRTGNKRKNKEMDWPAQIEETRWICDQNSPYMELTVEA